MIGFGTLIILGIVIGSVSFSMFLFLDNLTVDVTSESGKPVNVNDVIFDIHFVSYHEVLKKDKEYTAFEKNLEMKGIATSEVPDGIYFQIQITAHNIGTETVRFTGGQFYLYDINNNKYDAVFIGYGDNELSLIDLETNDSVTVTTQFDIPYDDEMQYKVGILPDKFGLQDSKERGFICIKNCY
ncbi:hypothetical protein AAA799O18_00209 [Marine Group I thaumarchaeote SCGC AAA799-O18]|jgi:hypothetical protein|nr:hypothetical protein AAA799O18_00209 [Marine Group I thaumarchaeote SCGC AAA799-O18]